MAIEPIRENLIKAGEALLRKVDELGLGLNAAAWVYFHGMNEWRFFVSTPLVDSMGQKKVYSLLADALDVIGTPEELTVFDLHLESPKGPLFSLISRLIEPPNGRAIFKDNYVNSVPFDAVLLRSVAPTDVAPKKVEAQFKRNVKKVMSGA